MDSTTNEPRRIRRGARNRVHIDKLPPFGEWNFIHEDNVPITQYFDNCTTQQHQPPPYPLAAHSSIYPYPIYGYYDSTATDGALFLNSMFPVKDSFHCQLYNNYTSPTPQQHYFNNTQLRSPSPHMRQIVKGGECGTRRRSRLENRNRVYNVTSTEANTSTELAVDVCYIKKSGTNVKAKDEDLYKIPPELLRKHNPKKKVCRFFSKCFVTVCAS